MGMAQVQLMYHTVRNIILTVMVVLMFTSTIAKAMCADCKYIHHEMPNIETSMDDMTMCGNHMEKFTESKPDAADGCAEHGCTAVNQLHKSQLSFVFLLSSITHDTMISIVGDSYNPEKLTDPPKS